MLEDTYGHTPLRKAFETGDVYGIGYDEARASRRRVCLGVVGAGGVAQSKYFPAVTRLRAIWEPVEITAFAEPVEAQAVKVREVFGARWYSDYDCMLRTEQLDGVLVLSPDALHCEHTVAALESGFHVLVEKPIARSLADSVRMCRMAEERGLTLMTVANKRFSPPYRRAKCLIEAGLVSNPALFNGKFNFGYDCVDLFEDGKIHLYDLARFLMCDVARLYAVGDVDNAVAALEFASGAIGSLYTTRTALSFKPWERVEVYGRHTWLAVEDQSELWLYDSEEGPAKCWRPVIPHTLLFDEEFGGYMGLIENFAQAIRAEEQPAVTGWDGHRALELSIAMHLSIARHEAVALPLCAEETPVPGR
jgi:predicted dehydrogenase